MYNENLDLVHGGYQCTTCALGQWWGSDNDLVHKLYTDNDQAQGLNCFSNYQPPSQNIFKSH